jgi:uncharacterized LabA/DUF88 family protein
MVEFRLRELLEDVLEAKGMEIDYYASKIRLPQLPRDYTPTEETIKYINEIREYNRRWIPCLQKQHITYRKAGYLRPRQTKPCKNCHTIQETLQEKGVDVRLASDMLEDVYKGNHDKVVLVSSDSDYSPALEKVIAHQAKIVYICFANFVNPSISGIATETVSISQEKIKKYYVEPEQPQLELEDEAASVPEED